MSSVLRSLDRTSKTSLKSKTRASLAFARFNKTASPMMRKLIAKRYRTERFLKSVGG